MQLCHGAVEMTVQLCGGAVEIKVQLCGGAVEMTVQLCHGAVVTSQVQGNSHFCRKKKVGMCTGLKACI